ncbi:uncharacterized protein [Spinacia oleracea]|uniref:CCHC-type domain-containing protein n=1 Tax=Spinacia oleracea TaxID=3562 RepID=A0A9R0JBA2_SPIOL|nr:uncharacterized protein LOC110802866 [Spinacia oleracea]
MRRIWNPKHGFEANCIEKNTFFFQFHHWKDKEQVMEAQPWHFERHTLALSDVNGEVKPSELPLHNTPFWVRIYDLPLVGRTNDANARVIGNKVGSFIKADKSDVIGINKSLRVRSMIDLRKPLKKEVTLKMRGGETESFPVKYEKLPLFCYVCGKLGHGEKDCEEAMNVTNPKRLYSDKLRASPWQVNKGDHGEEVEENITCARKLFVTKKKQLARRDGKGEEEVREVVQQLAGVTLSLGGRATVVEDKNEGRERHESQNANHTKPSENPRAEQGECQVAFVIGSSTKGERKLRKVNKVCRRRGEKGEDSMVCGKRKDQMEIDGEEIEEGSEGVKKSRALIFSEDTTSLCKVAEVASQPREYQ